MPHTSSPVLDRVRFKFLLGEVHLASWRPLFRSVRWTGAEAPVDWPTEADAPLTALDATADGYWCRQTPVGRYKLGLSRQGAWWCYVPRTERLHCIDFDGEFDDYLARWSAKSRYNLRRAVKKLRDRNTDALVDIADRPEQMDAFLRTAATISSTTYQSRLLKSGIRHDQPTLQALQRSATRGIGRGYLLRDQGRAIAFAWCAGEGDRLTYEVIGYLEESASCSPGTVLLYLIVEDLFRLKRFKVLDFGVGDAPYKQLFATRTLEFADAYLFRSRWQLCLLAWLHWQIDGLSANVGRLLERAGLKMRVKRWLRRLLR